MYFFQIRLLGCVKMEEDVIYLGSVCLRLALTAERPGYWPYASGLPVLLGDDFCIVPVSLTPQPAIPQKPPAANQYLYQAWRPLSPAPIKH